MEIDFEKLEKEMFSGSDFIKTHKSGVYAICAKTQYKDCRLGIEKILYIGSSKNIAKRILASNHPYIKLYNKSNHIVYTRSCVTENYVEAEIYFIKKYRPILNKTHNK